MFLGNWSAGYVEESYRDMFSDFGIPEETIKDHSKLDILFAYYSYENYTGEAFVLFRWDGKLYEVHGYHCSCHGLEGQWIPGETTKLALLNRLHVGRMGREYWGGGNTYAKELKTVLGTLDR